MIQSPSQNPKIKKSPLKNPSYGKIENRKRATCFALQHCCKTSLAMLRVLPPTVNQNCLAIQAVAGCEKFVVECRG